MIVTPRLARPTDRDEVFRMWECYAAENAIRGEDPVPGELTSAWCAAAFDDGVCVIAPGCGFSLAVGIDLPYNSHLGRLALGIGTWVQPEFRRQGLATAMRELLVDTLRARGFDTLTGGATIANRAAINSMLKLTSSGDRQTVQLQFVTDLRG